MLAVKTGANWFEFFLFSGDVDKINRSRKSGLHIICIRYWI